MRRFGAYFLVTCATVYFALSGTASAQIPDVPGWRLSYHDEFDGTTLNTTNWVPLDRQESPNNEKQFYTPGQVTVANGNLQLTATNQPLGTKQYRSGLITSKSLYRPGRFEARIDLPTTKGMWPAFWLNANDVDWPQGGEIDIMENRGSQPTLVSSAFHWQKDMGACCSNAHYDAANYTAMNGNDPVNFTTGFHTYATEWDTTLIRFYVDGNLYHTVNNNTHMPDFNFPMSDLNFTTEKNIILNLAVGGIFDGDPNGTTVFPQTMLVDYVRVWQRQTGMSGDYNGDQRVDAADYVKWRESLGQSGIGLPADGSGNGTVDDADFVMWSKNFGSGTGASGSLAISAPEPCCAALMTVALLCALGWRNIRCQHRPQARF